MNNSPLNDFSQYSSELIKFIVSLPKIIQSKLTYFLPTLSLSPRLFITYPQRTATTTTPAVGLENLGNTCFLNAMLQALASLPSMRKYVDGISSYDEQTYKLAFTRKLSKCFKELRGNSRRTISAKDIYLQITNYRRGLGDFEQQDVGECLQALIGIISNEEKALQRQFHCSVKFLFLSTSPQTSRTLPVFPFNGYVSSVVTCHKCNHSRPPRIQTFTELSLPVEAPLSTPPISLFNSHSHLSTSSSSSSTSTTYRSTGEVLKLQRLSDCLGRFAAGEILSDVECLSCSCQAQLESFRILTTSSWATDSQNTKSLHEINEKIKSLEQHHSSEEKLEELIPKNARERTTATKQLMVSKFPEILCFQLIRNIFDIKTQRMIKLKHHIAFPVEFHENDMCIGLNYRVNLSPNPHSSRHHHQHHHHLKGGNNNHHQNNLNSSSNSNSNNINSSNGNGNGNNSKGLLSRTLRSSSSSSSLSSSTSSLYGNDNDQRGKLYHLQAVIVHHGGSESGHYTTYAQLENENILQSGRGDGQKRRWAHFSDESVHEVEEKEVLGCEAYLLFYHRVNNTIVDNVSTEMKIS